MLSMPNCVPVISMSHHNLETWFKFFHALLIQGLVTTCPFVALTVLIVDRNGTHHGYLPPHQRLMTFISWNIISVFYLATILIMNCFLAWAVFGIPLLTINKPFLSSASIVWSFCFWALYQTHCCANNVVACLAYVGCERTCQYYQEATMKVVCHWGVCCEDTVRQDVLISVQFVFVLSGVLLPIAADLKDLLV